MVRTGEVRPNDNKIRALAQNVRHRDDNILMSFFLIKRGSVFMPSVSLLRAFFIAGILNLRKQSAATLNYQTWKRRVT